MHRMKLPPNPLVHELFTWVWLHDLASRLGRHGHAGRRAGRGVGRRRRRRRRRRLADGRVGAQPGRRGDRPHRTGDGRRPSGPPSPTSPTPTSWARPTASATTRSTSGSAGTSRAGRRPRRAGGARRRPGARLRPQPRRARPPVDARAPRVLLSRARPRTSLAIRRRSSPSATPCWRAAATRTSRPGRRWCSSTRRASDTRAAAAAVLASIAERADGVRCDMAMLMLDDVFARTWGERAAGGAVPRRRPGLLADRDRRRARPTTPTSCSGPRRTGTSSRCSSPRASTPATTSGSTTASCTGEGAAPDPRPPARRRRRTRRHTVRFVENHDEPRSGRPCSTPGPARAAAVTALTLPGVALLHEGQADGRTVRVPVTLGRRPVEAPDRGAAGVVRPAARRARPGGAPGVVVARSTSTAGPTTARASTSSPGAGTAPAPLARRRQPLAATGPTASFASGRACRRRSCSRTRSAGSATSVTATPSPPTACTSP